MTQLLNLPKGLWFVDQYDRMVRWYERFKKINDGRLVSPGLAIYDYDEVLAFFIFCYHLRDWIIQDVAVDKKHSDYQKFKNFRTEINAFVKNNDCLRLCEDICNSAKHQVLNRPTQFGEETTIRFLGFQIEETKNGQLCKCKWEIASESGKKFDLFEIATECVKKWFEFLKTHEIQIRELTDYWQNECETVCSYDPQMVKDNVIESKYVKVNRGSRKKELDRK